jgi:hypothetical protein
MGPNGPVGRLTPTAYGCFNSLVKRNASSIPNPGTPDLQESDWASNSARYRSRTPLSAHQESRSPPPVPLYIHTRTHPAISSGPPKPNHPSNHVTSSSVIAASANRSIRHHVIAAVRRRARRCRLRPGPGNNVTAAADAGTVPGGRVRHRPRA